MGGELHWLLSQNFLLDLHESCNHADPKKYNFNYSSMCRPDYKMGWTRDLLVSPYSYLYTPLVLLNARRSCY